LRSDARVRVMEETNARYVKSLPEPVSLVTIDASFISLKILLPLVKGWLASSPDPIPSRTLVPVGRVPDRVEGSVIVLIKPQFEAGRKESARHKGVIRDPSVHRTILMDVLDFARGLGFGVRGLLRSPVLGPKGNVEFLAWLGVGDAGQADYATLVDQVT